MKLEKQFFIFPENTKESIGLRARYSLTIDETLVCVENTIITHYLYGRIQFVAVDGFIWFYGMCVCVCQPVFFSSLLCVQFHAFVRKRMSDGEPPQRRIHE